MNMKYFCNKLQFRHACISHNCSVLFCNIFLRKYKHLVKIFRSFPQIFILFLLIEINIRKEYICLIPN